MENGEVSKGLAALILMAFFFSKAVLRAIDKKNQLPAPERKVNLFSVEVHM